MWNPPTKKQLALIPKLYKTEDIPLEEKKVYMKFFLGGWTWYAMEFDGKDTFFGFVVSPIEPEGSLGYFSLRELMGVKSGYVQVDRELHGITPRSPKKFKDIKTRGY